MPPRRAYARGKHPTGHLDAAGGESAAAADPAERWPRLILTSRKVSPAATPDPAPGTLVVGDDVTVLFVGRDWRPAPGATSQLADSLLGTPTLEIVGSTMAAAERARRRLRSAWRMTAAGAAGQLPPDVVRAFRERI